MKKIFALAAILLGLAPLAFAGIPFAVADEAGLLNRPAPRENLTASGQPTLEQLRMLTADGYTTIINLRRDREIDALRQRADVARLGLT